MAGTLDSLYGVGDGLVVPLDAGQHPPENPKHFLTEHRVGSYKLKSERDIFR